MLSGSVLAVILSLDLSVICVHVLVFFISYCQLGGMWPQVCMDLRGCFFDCCCTLRFSFVLYVFYPNRFSSTQFYSKKIGGVARAPKRVIHRLHVFCGVNLWWSLWSRVRGVDPNTTLTSLFFYSISCVDLNLWHFLWTKSHSQSDSIFCVIFVLVSSFHQFLFRWLKSWYILYGQTWGILNVF